MNFRAFIPAIIWLITVTVLLCLPGDDLPHSPFFDIPNFDKYVHLWLFFILTALFCFPFFKLKSPIHVISIWLFVITCSLIAYGVAMEFVQKYFASNRSFDKIDIYFDGAGCLMAYIAASLYNKYKKIGPDRNRGRNQN